MEAIHRPQGVCEREQATTLHLAAKTSNLAVLKLMANAGGDIGESGKTALRCATIEGQPAAAESLLSLGANHAHPTREGWTALRFAPVEIPSPDCARILVRQDADVDA